MINDNYLRYYNEKPLEEESLQTKAQENHEKHRGVDMLIYRILVADNYERLERLVNQAISDGWTLQGGVSCSLFSFFRTYAQAMTKNQ